MRYAIACLVFILSATLCRPLAALSATPRAGGWVPNGQVNAIAATPTIVFIGGEFTCLSPYTGGGVPIDATEGVPAGAFPEVNGFVYASAPDGSGGWYVGGEFSQVGGVARHNICHILADGSVDPAWNPGAGGLVRALAVSGGKVYVGGEFTSLGGQGRNRIGALDAVTGVADAWNPNAGGFVNALCVSGATVYAGGEFGSIGGESRSRIAALDGTTGAATTWNPAANDTVCSLTLDDGTLYAGGYFTTIGGESRNRIAALSTAAGTATSWNPGASNCVNALAVSHGMVFAGGSFSMIGGQPRSRLAAIDLATGAVETWNPGASSSVYALTVSGDTLYAGGAFSTCGGQPRNCLAAVDVTSGAVAAWNPTASSTVRTLAVAGSTVYAGGDFNGIGGVVRNHLAALDAATGMPAAWNPDVNNAVYSLAASGDTVYAGGVFSAIGGQSREFLAAVDISTGVPTEWAVNADGEVLALCVHQDILYVGGSFSQIAGEPRNNIAALNADTGTVTLWDPNSDNSVCCLAASEETVYAGGRFSNIGGQNRWCIAAIETQYGTATAFNPDSDNYVLALAVSGGVVYAGGEFTSLGGQMRNRIAALNPTTGVATSWDPDADGSVHALAVAGSSVYAGGAFISIGGSARNNLGAVDVETALASAWAPDPNNPVWAVAVAAGAVNVGGAFTHIGATQQEYFAQFDASLPAPGNPGATAIGHNAITWTWLDNSAEETGFNVYADPGAGPPATLRHTTGANAQSWQYQPLAANCQYAFQVAAANGAVESPKTANYTAWTQIEPVTGLVFSGLSEASVSVAAAGVFSNLTAASSGLRFENATRGTDSGWRQYNDAWASAGLQPNTQYSFTAQSRNGVGSTTTTAAAAKYTLAAVPTAPVVANPTMMSVDVAVGSGDGNPANTGYAIHVEPGVGGKNWAQADGSLGASPAYRTAAAWDAVTVTGLIDGRVYGFAVKARNGEGVETPLGPAAEAMTSTDMAPSLTFTLISEPETGDDTIEFLVEVDEVTLPEFGAAAVVVNGLPGLVVVTGGYPVYTVTVHLDDADSDGTVSITVPPGILHDADSNECPGGTSDVCHVYNWHGFAAEPESVAAYMHDLVTFDATAACGASCVTYHWKWEDAAKVLSDVGANSPLLLIEDVDASNVGTYWCEVSYDGLVHPTAPAALSVEERVVILPLDPQTVAEGETCTFSVSATGGYLPLSYAWSKDGSPIPDAHASTYTTLPLEASDSGSVYTVTVADSNGDQQSASVEVTVALGVPAAGVAGMLALFVVLTAVSRRK